MSVYREPDEETVGLYPGLVVHDGRVSGSITYGSSRLPLRAGLADLITEEAWQGFIHDYGPLENGWSEHDLSGFLYSVLEQRGEFARLLLVLADVERRSRHHERPWWYVERSRSQVRGQLRRCLDCLEPSTEE